MSDQGIGTLYVDGDAQPDIYVEPDDRTRVQVEWDAVASGYVDNGWLNSAAIDFDDSEESCTVTLSVGDPRGAFRMTVRRLPDGSLILHVPHPGDSAPHVELTEIRPGTYQVYGPRDDA